MAATEVLRPNLLFEFNSHILSKLRHDNFLQKLTIPASKFPINTKPGTLAFCSAANRKYICRIYAMRNTQVKHSEIDDSVSLIINENNKDINIREDVIISKIDIISEPVVQADFVSVFVTISRLKIASKVKLEKLIKNILQPYYLFNGCRVKFNDQSSFGFTEICVKATNSNTVFRVGNVTTLEVQDVCYRSVPYLQWTDLKGLNDIYLNLLEKKKEIELKNKNITWKFNPSLNVLLIGAPGTGKTAVCHNFILDQNCNFFGVDSSDVMKSRPGETEDVLRGIFHAAEIFIKKFESKRLTVMLIENVDLLCPAQGFGSNLDHIGRVSQQLFYLLDKFHTSGMNLFVIGTTSNIDAVSPALRRSGRFENEITISAPSEKLRIEILSSILKTNRNIINKSNEKIIKYIATNTCGYMGSDIVLLAQTVFHSFAIQNLDLNDSSRMKKEFENILHKIRPSSLRSTLINLNSNENTLNNIGGLHLLKKALEISILASLKYPNVFRKFGLQTPKGILLYGPPGCAKTTLVKCLAADANMTLISVSAAEVYSPFVGSSERFITKIFNIARRNSPCMIFLDEIDAIVGNRVIGTKNDVQTRILSILLTEMDGIGTKIRTAKNSCDDPVILVLAATNRPDMLDNALLRPGRFDKIFHVPAPNRSSRLELLNIYQKKMPFSNDIDVGSIADITENFSGADLCNLCNEAAINAISKNIYTTLIHKNDFNDVLKTVKPSINPEQIKWYFDFERQTS